MHQCFQVRFLTHLDGDFFFDSLYCLGFRSSRVSSYFLLYLPLAEPDSSCLYLYLVYWLGFPVIKIRSSKRAHLRTVLQRWQDGSNYQGLSNRTFRETSARSVYCSYIVVGTLKLGVSLNKEYIGQDWPCLSTTMPHLLCVEEIVRCLLNISCEDGYRTSFRNSAFYSEYLTIDKVQKSSSTMCNITVRNI
jgi:hypothetical protein